MALPVKAYRGDIVVMVEFDPVGAAGTYTNWCGVTNISLQISNEIKSEKTGDCADWSAVVQTSKSYSGQDITMTVDATFAKSMYSETLAWALEQKELNVRVHYTAAATGEVEFLDGAALMAGLNPSGIGNVEGDAITESISLEFNGGLTPTNAV